MSSAGKELAYRIGTLFCLLISVLYHVSTVSYCVLLYPEISKRENCARKRAALLKDEQT